MKNMMIVGVMRVMRITNVKISKLRITREMEDTKSLRIEASSRVIGTLAIKDKREKGLRVRRLGA